MAKVMLLFLFSFVLAVITFHMGVVLPTAAAAISNMAPSLPLPAPRPGCSFEWCGNVEIPYPFSIRDDCAANWPELAGFNIICNDSFSPPKPFSGELEVLKILVESGEMLVVGPVASICYESYNTTVREKGAWSASVSLTSSFVISERSNRFTAIGCNTTAFVTYSTYDDSARFLTGCLSTCESLDDVAKEDGKCTGIGCCQTTVPANLSSMMLDWGNATGAVNPAWNYSPCSYAFVADKDWYKGDLRLEGDIQEAPLMLDWTVATNEYCLVENGTTNACASYNSDCVEATQKNGYLCNCSAGYHGNPYRSDGCQDINECHLRESNPTIYEQLYPCGNHSECHNTEGGYYCICKRFYLGVGNSNECVHVAIIVAPLFAIVLVAVLLWMVLRGHKQRRRARFYDKNGGKLLQGAGITIYSEEDLAKITNRYNKSIGRGSFGKVFVGTTKDNQRVAVKRAIIENSKKTQVGGDFIHEILVQFQMTHANLVRLIGCCLETDVPMLVFELVPNGSLFDVLHDSVKRRALSLLQRLDIAVGSAKALAYMHNSGDHKRIHGDVKSENILLDDNLLPKVSDFGSSKVMPTASRYVTFVASDMNYVDPVYMKTNRFTQKSDVYSFGVVLLEIITRKPAKDDQNNSGLPVDFVKCCKAEGNGRKMYDEDILNHDDANSHMFLDRIAALAVQCLKADDDDRPTMQDVEEELTKVKKDLADETLAPSPV